MNVPHSTFHIPYSAFRIPHSAVRISFRIPHSAFRIHSAFRSPQSAVHCTLAATDALPASVKVQLLRLLPPLEQAPDQTASRPFETVSVIDAPTVNDADPVLPTATLNPAGVDVTRSPLRPLAVSVSVAV
jgi:hypothetical protein